MLVLRSQMWQRIDDFIRVFISFLYSTKEEIGFDPTVKRVIFHKEICYVYQVGGRFFRTIKPLFLSRVLCITGRKTRVWEAVEVSGTSKEEIGEEMNGGKRFAVKDVWLDKDSSTEKENLDKIFAALDEVDMNKYEWDPSFNTTDNTYLQQIIGDVLREKEYNRYFMDIVCDQRGKLTREPAQDAVPDPKMFDTNPMPQMAKQTRSGTQQLSQQSSKYSGRSGSTPLRAAALHSRDYKAKFQYRLVYDDVGEPLDEAANLKSFSQGIYDACIGMSCSSSIND